MNNNNVYYKIRYLNAINLELNTNHFLIKTFLQENRWLCYRPASSIIAQLVIEYTEEDVINK